MEACEAELVSLRSNLSLNHVEQEVEKFKIFRLHSAPPPTLQDSPPAVLSLWLPNSNDRAGEKRSPSPLFVLAGVAVVGVGSMPPKTGLADHGL